MKFNRVRWLCIAVAICATIFVSSCAGSLVPNRGDFPTSAQLENSTDAQLLDLYDNAIKTAQQVDTGQMATMWYTSALAYQNEINRRLLLKIKETVER